MKGPLPQSALRAMHRPVTLRQPGVSEARKTPALPSAVTASLPLAPIPHDDSAPGAQTGLGGDFSPHRENIENSTEHFGEVNKMVDTNPPPYDDHAQNTGTTPKLECHPGHAPLGQKEVQGCTAGRILVRVLSVRKRLLDEDNLCEKFIVDSLRSIGAIPGDEPDKIRIETTQRKAAKGEEECTEITIEYP